MRAVVVLMALMLSVPALAQSQTVMYVRPPGAVLCSQLDLAKVAVQMATEAMQARRGIRPPAGCWTVQPGIPVVMLDQFDEYAYISVDPGASGLPSRLWVHVGALSATPESPPPRRRR